jgi:rod shape-determining protein MreC
MFGKFITTKIFIVVLVVAVCGLLIFLNPSNFFSPVRTIFLEIFSPFQKIAYLSSLKLERAREFIFSIGQIKKENEKLLKENQKLLSENAKLSDTKRQNDVLKEQLGLLPREKFALENAYVIGQDPNGFGNWIEISKGSGSGIGEGMPVIVSEGFLIGKIGEVQKNSSQVILTTNPRSIVNAMVSETGTKGIVRGEFGLGIIFDMILQTETVNPGDAVITSGIGKGVPRGIFIGNVRDVKLSSDRLFQQATVVSPVQFSKLEIVSVIKGSN